MIIKPARLVDLITLDQLYVEAFESNAHFFPDNMEETDDEGEDFSLEAAINMPDKSVIGLWEGDCLIGGAVISTDSHSVNILERLFISPEKQGRGYGYLAWTEIEKRYYCENGWELRTPTCLINNVCFYVNKCGFVIVRIEDMGRDGVGMYVFQKNQHNPPDCIK
ncbi:hypothetical protein OI70_16575 [Dickeya fangzhongdai]|uniref:GNAT family N-acetyltransferase n=1 Tax=Dickeya fangzhongdai TaxID=1778540 RepID=UPI000575AD41|nr:GNAT family N-acetyltransferase [Dickeya fangzhongdai]KHN54268.1 hypothetical protein OI70_16575 [Dickeya fangzhongdai]